ncbi:hypothetical protein [Streptacidiphilus sp. MAP5-3]|uniref:hypothetical protein n=1 Tax=unclassified Streptacidiphilus TaxID=2643834 RepID=UPI003519BE11
MQNVITPLSRADLANNRIRALLARARGRRLTTSERDLYTRLVNEYLAARNAANQPLEIATAA